jgi:hypothetical protein
MLTPDRTSVDKDKYGLLTVAFESNHTKSRLFLDLNYQAPFILVPKFGI